MINHLWGLTVFANMPLSIGLCKKSVTATITANHSGMSFNWLKSLNPRRFFPGDYFAHPRGECSFWACSSLGCRLCGSCWSGRASGDAVLFLFCALPICNSYIIQGGTISNAVEKMPNWIFFEENKRHVKTENRCSLCKHNAIVIVAVWRRNK